MSEVRGYVALPPHPELWLTADYAERACRGDEEVCAVVPIKWLEQAEADRAKVERVEVELARAVEQQFLAIWTERIRAALNPDTGGTDARAMLDQVQRDAQADLTRIHDTIRPGFIGGTDA